MTLSEFISQSHAEQIPMNKNYWNVYVDGDNKQGCIHDCYGETEFQAKESAFEFYNSLKEEIESQLKKPLS